MKRSTVAAVLGLTLLGGCSWHDEPAATSTWRAPTPRPTSTAVPRGLVALAVTTDRTELRVYDARTGARTRTLPFPAVVRGLSFSDDFAYAARIEPSDHTLVLYVADGDRYRQTDVLHATQLGLDDLGGAGFVPHTDLVAIESPPGDAVVQKTRSLDPANPLGTLQDNPGPVDGGDSSGLGVETAYLSLSGVPGIDQVNVRSSTREVVDATVTSRPDANGHASILYYCYGGPVATLTVACRGMAAKAEVALLTAAPSHQQARLRVLGAIAGKPFTSLTLSPDRKQLLAGRADGFYRTPITGGTPQRAFGPLTGGGKITVLTWR
jgi:hypothetical protein